jgi:hypothetical protein
MTQSLSRVVLSPCPFCGEALFIRKGVNAYGRCDTPDCWTQKRAVIVPLDDPRQVEAWNKRAAPAPDPDTLSEAVERATTAEARSAKLTEALDLALDFLSDFEPGDSRAVSNEYVAMAAVCSDIEPNSPDEEMGIIRAAKQARNRARKALENPTKGTT